MTITIENAIPDPFLSINELTEASLEGNGVFDVLLRTFQLHLDREFKNARITGTAYATVYAQLIPTFLQQAVAYTTAKTKLSLELDGLQKQNALLDAQREQVLAETNKIATDTVVAIKQGHLIEAQICETQARTNQVNAEVGLRLPVEVENLKKQGLQIDAQTSLIGKQELQVMQETDNLVAQKEQIIAQTDLIRTQDETAEYALQHKLPLEVAILEKQRDQLSAEISKISTDTLLAIRQVALTEANTCQVKAQTDRLLNETANKLPEEINLLKKQALQVLTQTALTHTQQLATEQDILKTQAEVLNIPKQGENIDAQTQKILRDFGLTDAQIEKMQKEIQLADKELELKDKNLDLLDAQIKSQESQNELYEQKTITEQAQTDPSVIKTGSILDLQNGMIRNQADAFLRDAEQKATKILVDTWSLRKNTDPDGNPENSTNKLEDANIGHAIQRMLAGIQITV